MMRFLGPGKPLCPGYKTLLHNSLSTRFKKEHYHKVPLQKELKEIKECREAFRNAQLPYKKALDAISKARKAS